MIEQIGQPLETPVLKQQYFAEDYEYRQQSARLERRKRHSTIWFEVTGDDMLRMTPDELRLVAAIIERRSTNA